MAKAPRIPGEPIAKLHVDESPKPQKTPEPTSEYLAIDGLPPAYDPDAPNGWSLASNGRYHLYIDGILIINGMKMAV